MIVLAAACSSRWVALKGWFLLGTVDGFIHVFNYRKKMQNITSLKVCGGAVNSLAIHPTRPYVLSACPTGIKLWDWHNHWFAWKCMQTFEEHIKDVRAVVFNPEDYNSFASASNDGTIKVFLSLLSLASKYSHNRRWNMFHFLLYLDSKLL
jgi:WD40 repeat protein